MVKSFARPAAAPGGRGRSALDVAVGVAGAILLTLLGTLVFALVLRLFRAPESGVPVFTVSVKAAAALLGGALSARRHMRRGWMRGALCGFLYILAARLVFMAWGGGFAGGWSLILDLLLGSAAGALGGILAIRRKK